MWLCGSEWENEKIQYKWGCVCVEKVCVRQWERISALHCTVLLSKLCGMQTGMNLVVQILLPIIIMCSPYTVSVGRCGPATGRFMYVHCTHVIGQTVCVVFWVVQSVPGCRNNVPSYQSGRGRWVDFPNIYNHPMAAHTLGGNAIAVAIGTFISHYTAPLHKLIICHI